MVQFHLLGFPVTVQPWHWAILAFCGDALGIRDPEDLLPVLLFMPAGFVSILIHELGHALTMRQFGCRHVSIVLHGFGGYALSQGARFTRGQQILVSLAGPLLQAACGLFLLFLLRESLSAMSEWARRLTGSFVLISLYWAILNLIPVFPLDGGQVLKAFLGPRRIQLTLGISMSVAIVVACLIYLTSGSILFPILLVYMAVENYKALKHGESSRGW